VHPFHQRPDCPISEINVSHRFSTLRVRILVSCLVGCTLATAGAAPRLYVDSSAAPGGDGLQWSTALQEVRDALSVAGGDPNVAEIWVAAGTYTPDSGCGDRTRAFCLIEGVSILGGFNGTETSPDQRDPAANRCLLIGHVDDPHAPSANFSNDSIITQNAILALQQRRRSITMQHQDHGIDPSDIVRQVGMASAIVLHVDRFAS